MGSFNLARPLCIRGKNGLRGSQSKSGPSGEERISCWCQGSNTISLSSSS